ncbi:hypothetical protein QV06_03570 [Gallibacterium genomosp. 3]|uniref:Uncharacterized protein n=1 Tax=Gallibacterium genomosp. 3 TaxID=505345 RepID=A0A1A7PRU3_9PAST|nr:hypothetical protein [Gallibacterium genomosp. 3]OBX05288.1 hypothetical protein QV06_03570 [Gallibacterium genomosp. 3]
MKKLFTLKKWLSLEDAAEYLTSNLNEAVNKADILQLAVDEELRISVYFPHSWIGKICDITTDEKKGGNYKEVIGLQGEKVKIYEYDKYNDKEFMKVLPDKYHFKSGVYELKLIGNEKIDLEWQLKKEKNLPVVDVFNLNGFYVKNKDNIVIERQTKLNQDEYLALQKECRNDIKKKLNENIEFTPLEKANISSQINSEKFKKETFTYPCSGIGEIEGAFFVIQTEHLKEFINKFQDKEQESTQIQQTDYNVDIPPKTDNEKLAHFIDLLLEASPELRRKDGKKPTYSELHTILSHKFPNERIPSKGTLKKYMGYL